MANIQNELNNIKTALYGKDVRNSIHDAIKTCYDDASVNNDNANMEVKLARGTHNTLNDRLCEVDEKQSSLSSQLEHIANVNLGEYLNSSTSINEAIKTALKNMESGKILIPQGEYIITDTIIIDKPVYLQFSVGTKIINPFTNKRALLITHDNVIIENCEFIGNSNRSDVSYAITLASNVKNVKIENNIIKNFNGGIMLISQNENISIFSNEFYDLLYTSNSDNTAGYGIVLQSSKNCRITNNTFNNVERHHIYMGRNPENLELTGGSHIISNNTFIGCNKDKYFTGNEFLVKLMGNQNVTVTGNTFDGGVGHLWLTSFGRVKYHCENISITGNTFRNLEGEDYASSCMIGSASDNTNSYLSEVINCSITGNTLIDCNSTQAMKFDKISNSLISSNTIKNCSQTGIYITNGSMNTTISDNIIDGTTRAIHLVGVDDYKEINIINNIITNATFCLYISGMNFLYIKSNVLKSIKYQPIYLTNCIFTHASITNNDILGGNSGITITSNCSERILITDNHFYNQTTNKIDNQSSCLIFKINYINGIRDNIEFYSTGKPSSGSFKQGDICMVINPGEGNDWGYICTSGGSPGTWKSLGKVGS